MLLNERTNGLFNRLNQELRSFTPGSRFYSIRQLMLRYRVSRRVVDAALAELEKCGAIETRPQCGIFVLHNAVRKQIALLIPDWPSEGNKLFATRLKLEFAKHEARYDFSTITYDCQDNLLERLCASPAHVNIVVWPGRPLTRAEIHEITMLPSEVVIMWNDLAAISLHSVRTDGAYGGMLAASYLIRNGHRKLAVMASEPRNRDVDTRIAGFINTARLFGAEAAEIPCEVRSGDYSMTRTHDALERHLREYGREFSALFLMSDESTQGAVAALAESGCTIPDDVSIIGYGNDRSANYFRPPLTTITGRHHEVAARLAEAVDLLLKGKCPLIDIRVNPAIVERQSVRNLKAPQNTGESK